MTTQSTVLDVACGTGVAAREALGRVGPTGSVTGLDLAPGMLAVAESIEPGVTWINGDAGRLPFDDGDFDAVVSQFGLMFFPDRVGAIHEMLRCAKPGGRVAWPCGRRLNVQRFTPSGSTCCIVGPVRPPPTLRAPFVLGDTGELRHLFEAAGASDISIDTHHGTARFPGVRSMAEADLRGWLPLMGVTLDDELITAILTEAEDVLRDYVTVDGTMIFDAPAHIVTAQA